MKNQINKNYFIKQVKEFKNKVLNEDLFYYNQEKHQLIKDFIIISYQFLENIQNQKEFKEIFNKLKIEYLILTEIVDIYNAYNKRLFNEILLQLKDIKYSKDNFNDRFNILLKLLSYDEDESFVIKDPTGTKIGQIFAEHITQMLTKEGKTFNEFIIRGGFCSTIYNSKAHRYNVNISKLIHAQNILEIKQIMKNIQIDKLEDSYQKYLFDNIELYLKNTKFRYSKSVSKKQDNNFLWIFPTYINNIDDNLILTKKRIYINVKASKILESCQYIAQTVTNFINSNQGLEYYISFKFKVRTLLNEMDRSDTCICYIELRRGIEQHANAIISFFESKLSKIPLNFINNLSSPFLHELKPGITAIDNNVKRDPRQSYTSQFGASMFNIIKRHEQEGTVDYKNKVKFCENLIIEVINDLKLRGYKVN